MINKKYRSRKSELGAALLVCGLCWAAGVAAEDLVVYDTYTPASNGTVGVIFNDGPMGWNAQVGSVGGGVSPAQLDAAYKARDRIASSHAGVGRNGTSLEAINRLAGSHAAVQSPHWMKKSDRMRRRSGADRFKIPGGACDGNSASCITGWHLEARVNGDITEQEYFDGAKAHAAGAAIGAFGAVGAAVSLETALAHAATYGWGTAGTTALFGALVAGETKMLWETPMFQETFVGPVTVDENMSGDGGVAMGSVYPANPNLPESARLVLDQNIEFVKQHYAHATSNAKPYGSGVSVPVLVETKTGKIISFGNWYQRMPELMNGYRDGRYTPMSIIEFPGNSSSAAKTYLLAAPSTPIPNDVGLLSRANLSTNALHVLNGTVEAMNPRPIIPSAPPGRWARFRGAFRGR